MGKRNRSKALDHPLVPYEERQGARIAWNMLGIWDQSQVVLRVDNEFVDALLSLDTDVPLVPDWLTQLPFDAFAVSLPTPLSLHDGRNLCHHVGFMVTGIRHGLAPSRSEQSGSDRYQSISTQYGSLAEGDGIRSLWLFTADQDPTSRCQTVTAGTDAPMDVKPLTTV